MKTLISVLLFSVALSAPVFADSQHHGKESQPSSNNMMDMKEHMQSMQAMMKSLKQEPNPEKRSELIDAHMQSMKKGMMMNNHSEDGDASMPMGQRMDMMNKRINMMQMMMGQMMDIMIETRKERPKYLKK